MTWWSDKTLGIVGLGNMGHAIAAGVAESGLLSEGAIIGFDPKVAAGDVHPAIGLLDSGKDVAEASDVLVIAVKPHAVASVLRELLEDCTVELVISIAAGLPLKPIEEAAADHTQGVVRAMPNIAASVQASCTAIVGGQTTEPKHVDAAEMLFGCVGTVARLGDEQLMHGFTGGVGSGIAYGFVFAEALADGIVAEGLDRATARRAAASVLRGAAELLLDDESISPAARKDAVCSPGGTTIEGVTALESHKFRAATIAAVRQASEKSRRLAGDGDA